MQPSWSIDALLTARLRAASGQTKCLRRKPLSLTLMATKSIMSKKRVMAMIETPSPSAEPPLRENHALYQLMELFRGAKWHVVRQEGSAFPDLVVRRGSHHYAVELKIAGESRRDRLIPLLAAAILESQAAVRRLPGASPLAVVAAPRVPERMIAELLEYAERVASEVAVGIIDLDGRVEMRGAGLADLSSNVLRDEVKKSLPAASLPVDLFSDANQWMLKVLLAPRLPASLLKAPRSPIPNGAELARIAGVSAPSAFRLVRHLHENGWLDEGPRLNLVRVEELLRRWKAACVRPQHEYKMRWLLPGNPAEQLVQALRQYRAERAALIKKSVAREHRERSERRVPLSEAEAHVPPLGRACLGLFSAAEALDLGHVRGVPQHLYMEHVDLDGLERLGLSAARVGEPVHVVVRRPRWPRSIFNSAVDRDGVLVSDVLQVWLDVAEYPSRGVEQAEQIWKRVLKPIVGERDDR